MADSFGEVLQKVAEKNPRILAAHYLINAGQADVRAARASYRPQLGVTADFGWNNTTQTAPAGSSILPEVALSQMVYDGGRTPAEIRRRKVHVEVLSLQEQAALADISQQLAQAWVDYTRSAELLEVGRQQVSALELLEQVVRDIAQYDRGRASDVVMVDSRLEQARTSLDTRRIAMAEARARIREIAALPVEPAGPLPELSHRLPANADGCASLVADSLAVRGAELDRAENAEAERATRNWWLPQLSIEAARTSERTLTGQTNILNGTALRLRASVVPFDSGAGAARHASATATLASSQSRADLARATLDDQVRRLWSFQAERARRLPSLVDLVQRANDARDIVFEQFRIGRRTILDVLSYDLERFNVRAQLVNERYDIVQTQYQLLGALGRIYPVVANGESLPGARGDRPNG